MKLPVQAAAVLREGRSWPARRSSAGGISAALGHNPRKDVQICRGDRRDVNICAYDGTSPKCGDDMQVYNCPDGTCQCCTASGPGVTQEPGGYCKCS